ncbi:MAG: family 1 glycosylhydrolase [Cellulomonadaceae bacterium]|nr:family 1 glycosylhydrolase [Cellulomonadaceae bacterium]
MNDGLPVLGYIHWCLADDFEWFKGYEGNFGLVEVDRATQRRRIRPSAITLGRIAAMNAV